MRNFCSTFFYTMLGLLTRPAVSFLSSPLQKRPFIVLNSLAPSSSSLHTLGESDEDDNMLLLLQPLVVCGPSGVGKGTIIEKFMSEYGGADRFGFTVSHTTRQPRQGEVHGKHYHFCTPDIFQTQPELFMEMAEVHGNYYGTSWASLRDVQIEGKHSLLDIDVQGVMNLKTLEDPSKLQPRYLFVAPPSLEILQERLAARGTESPESLHRRTQNAKSELEYGLHPDNFDAIVVNSELDKACRDFDEAIRKMYNE